MCLIKNDYLLTCLSSKRLILKLKLQYFGHLMWRVDSLEKTLMMERLMGRGEGWDGWMALPTRWTWVWANSRREWRMGKPGVLQATGVTKSQTWLKDWTTKLISYQSFFLCEYSVYTLSQLLPIEQWITFLCSYELFPYLGNLASVIFVTKPFVGADCF